MAEEDDLITIVDVTDPDDPSYADVKTRRRFLTDQELANLRPMLEKVGAYKFFSSEFNFADGPAVRQFIETVELQEFKRCKQRKIVQETMKGTVAGREVVIDSELIEKTFGLLDDGESIIKPKGETNGLHAFYIKPKYVQLCQNYRGVYLKLFKSEYAYFVNMAHQIQTYCCGGPPESQITLTQYRAIDLMVRGKPVNWNRYLLQNFQDKLRKYKTGPCSLYFGGTLTALIYKALNVDYNLVNKPLLIPPQTPERLTGSDVDKGGKSSKKKEKPASGQKTLKDSSSQKKREIVKREVGAMTRAQRLLAPASESMEMEAEPSSKKPSRTVAALKALQDKKRKRVKQKVDTDSSKKQKVSTKQKQADSANNESMDTDMENNDTEDDGPSSVPTSPVPTTPYTEGGIRKRIADVEKLGGEIVLRAKTDRLSGLYTQATGSPVQVDRSPLLTASKDLWSKYDHLFSLQHEYQLEHIVSKQMLEQALERMQELEETIKQRDQKVDELEKSKAALEEQLKNQKTASSAEPEEQAVNPEKKTEEAANEAENGENKELAPLKIRLKVGQKKVDVPDERAEDVPDEGERTTPMETDQQPETLTEKTAEEQAVVPEKENGEEAPVQSGKETEKSDAVEVPTENVSPQPAAENAS